MNEAAAVQPRAGKCRLCGMAIAGTPFASANDEYCCEGCFLAARKRHTLAEADDVPYFALAEALAGLSYHPGVLDIYPYGVYLHAQDGRPVIASDWPFELLG